MSRDLDGVLAAIDGALADDDLPDAMRWAPDPEAADNGVLPFDGQHVTVGPDLARHHTTPGGMYRGPLRSGPGVPGFAGGAVAPARLSYLGAAIDTVLAHERAQAQHEANLARLREVLTLSPEQLDRMGDTMRSLGLAAQQAVEAIGRAFVDLAEGLRPVLDDLREAGVLPDDGPTDPRARALWLRQRRNTGPEVPRAQAARRPRRHR